MYAHAVLTADRRWVDYMRHLSVAMFLVVNIMTLAREQLQEVPESCQRVWDEQGVR